MAELFRINGVGHEFAQLLEAFSVDIMPELAQRNSENLLAKMEKVNKTHILIRKNYLKEVEKSSQKKSFFYEDLTSMVIFIILFNK